MDEPQGGRTVWQGRIGDVPLRVDMLPSGRIFANISGRLGLDRSRFLARRAIEQDRNEKARCNQAAAHDYTSVHFRPSSLAPK